MISVAQFIQAVPELCLSVFGQFKPWLLVTQRDVVIIEWQHYGIVTVGEHESHLAIFFCDNWHGDEVIDIDEGRTQKIIFGMEHDASVHIFDAILAILLKDLVEANVFFFIRSS